jgi:hypothetical protein
VVTIRGPLRPPRRSRAPSRRCSKQDPERLEAATAEAKDVLRELHEALRDGRRMGKEQEAETHRVGRQGRAHIDEIGQTYISKMREFTDRIDRTMARVTKDAAREAVEVLAPMLADRLNG